MRGRYNASVMPTPTARGRILRAAGLVLLNLAVAATLQLAWSALPRSAGAAAKPVVPPAVSDEDKIVDVIAKASPAVVSVLVERKSSDDAAGVSQLEEIGRGTGFIVDASGLIATNRHVASARDGVYTVYLTDGRSFSATVADIDPVNDLALLKIDAKGLPSLALEVDDRMRIGQKTIAIGNALGKYANTVTSGILSGVERDIEASDGRTGATERLEELLQTDAAINVGNSGGPLLNSAGRVIGMNTAVESGAQGLGFAIPVSEIRKVLDSYRRYGAIARPRLGVRYLMITPELADERGLALRAGALVESGDPNLAAVLPNSPAATAGLHEGDVILEINGKTLDGAYTLAKAVQGLNVGDAVTMKVSRAGALLTLKTQLDAHPPYADPQ